MTVLDVKIDGQTIMDECKRHQFWDIFIRPIFSYLPSANTSFGNETFAKIFAGKQYFQSNKFFCAWANA